MPEVTILDCTFRDGGYYNLWDFSPEVVEDYLLAMSSAGVGVAEMGFRSLRNTRFKGPFAYTTDSFLLHFNLSQAPEIGVMVNASEILEAVSLENALQELFPNSCDDSPVSLVRLACHLHEVKYVLPAVCWLKQQGYKVGLNLMQIAQGTYDNIGKIVREIANYPVDVLYFADSLGGMNPASVTSMIVCIRTEWSGPIGFHAHDNMGLALQNTLQAKQDGASWLDATVTGMGRGPGNTKTEHLALELNPDKQGNAKLVPLLRLSESYFGPMQQKFGWGTNFFYFLAGKYDIHPTYVQEMMSDSRYSYEEMLSVLERLERDGGKRFSLNTLDAARHFYHGSPRGSWEPQTLIRDKEVLLLGTGPGVAKHRQAIDDFIHKEKPFVMALNTQSQIESDLIDARVACHPTRLRADCRSHLDLPQPLITPFSMLPDDIRDALAEKQVLDFGLEVKAGCFEFGDTHCTVPSSLVVVYALAIAARGGAPRILMAGFDGYGEQDPRNHEMNRLLSLYQCQPDTPDIVAVTPTRYNLPEISIYGKVENR